MVTTIRLFSYLPRPNIITFLVFLLLSGFLLLKLQDSSGNSSVHETTQNSKITPKNDLRSDSNQPSISPIYICDKLGPVNNHSFILSSYCAKVPVPIDGWTRAEKYNEFDIGFLIYTDSNFSHTKATAMRDTWLSRVTHKYFLNQRPYSWLPTTVINGSGNDRTSNMQRIFYGLKIIYNEQKNSLNPHKWYYLGSCDTFINVPHLLKKLDSYDYTKPFFLGGLSNLTTCLDSKGQQHDIEYPSSNAGFFLSSKLLASMMPNLPDSIETISSRNTSDSSDVILTCLIYKLGIQLTNLSGYWAPNSDHSLVLDGQDDEHWDPEPNNFPFVSSDQMYDLDEFYSFLHVDRLVNDQNWKELTDYIRLFLSSHYESLRNKKMSQ